MAETLTRLQVPDAERKEAKRAASLLEHAVAHSGFFLTLANGEQMQVEMPASLLAAVKNILVALAENSETIVINSIAEISPEKAAEILGISRPLVYQRMDSGRLPFRQVGSHRRVRAADVAALRQFEDQRRSFAAALSADTEDLEENYAEADKSAP